jgi:hypothetical protein
MGQAPHHTEQAEVMAARMIFAFLILSQFSFQPASTFPGFSGFQLL